MKMKIMLMGAIAAVLAGGIASAQPYNNDNQRNNDYQRNGNDANGYYSQTDPNGYYDRNGRYQKMRRQEDRRDNGNDGNYYRQGAYEQNCQRGNQAAGTIFGAIAGGLIGSAASRGNGGAVVGGAVLGGLLGNTISKDISCDDQPYAFQTYSVGLNGNVGQRYDWNHGQSRGNFTPIREYRRNNTVCRDFTETTYTNGREFTRTGTSCRAQDGNWRFD
jgi:surface antigen